MIFNFLLSNNLIRSSSSASGSKEMETFLWLPKGFVSWSWKSFTFLTSVTLQVFQNGPLLGALEIFIPQADSWQVRWLPFFLECRKRVNVKRDKKEMARKNQQDIRCFEADTFRQELIDDLKINSSRVKFSLQKKKIKQRVVGRG